MKCDLCGSFMNEFIHQGKIICECGVCGNERIFNDTEGRWEK